MIIGMYFSELKKPSPVCLLVCYHFPDFFKIRTYTSWNLNINIVALLKNTKVLWLIVKRKKKHLSFFIQFKLFFVYFEGNKPCFEISQVDIIWILTQWNFRHGPYYILIQHGQKYTIFSSQKVFTRILSNCFIFRNLSLMWSVLLHTMYQKIVY